MLKTTEDNPSRAELAKVANFIKNGNPIKGISEILNLSRETIKSHRKNIREKFGIKNQKATFRTYLLSIK
jgi:DNA-binding CsgD family transcriptional regulator